MDNTTDTTDTTTASSQPPTLGGIMRTAAVHAFIAIAIVVAAVGGYSVWNRHGKPYQDPRVASGAWCHQLYAQAHTAAESSAVDARRTSGGGAPGTDRLCHELRLAHLADR